MAAVLAYMPDLLFGSKVEGMLAAAGHDVTLIADPGLLPDRAPAADVLVVDLTADAEERIGAVAAVREGCSGTPHVLAFYSHVEPGVRAAAEAEGFPLVVPRSRMNREAAALVERLAGLPDASGSAGPPY